MIFRKLSRTEIPDYLPLVLNVFCEFEASNYPEQAKMIFKSAICDQNYLAMLNAYGAYKDDVPIGIIATRSEGKHIALFFVDGKYHKQGMEKTEKYLLTMLPKSICYTILIKQILIRQEISLSPLGTGRARHQRIFRMQ